MRPETTPIRIDEDGDETHESWVTIAASKLSGGTRLFDSEITHQHWVRVRVQRATRKRKLNHDWIHASLQTLIEVDMSEAQWGAFVSSFGSGNGVPATLTRLANEAVPSAPFESRLNESHREVREAGARALAEVKDAHAALQEAFDRGAGKKEMRSLLAALGNRLGNAPHNMEFAAKSLTEHVENVVTKARFDIEAAALAVQIDPELAAGGIHGLLEPPASSPRGEER